LETRAGRDESRHHLDDELMASGPSVVSDCDHCGKSDWNCAFGKPCRGRQIRIWKNKHIKWNLSGVVTSSGGVQTIVQAKPGLVVYGQSATFQYIEP
jgi:hypothetical protein